VLYIWIHMWYRTFYFRKLYTVLETVICAVVNTNNTQSYIEFSFKCFLLYHFSRNSSKNTNTVSMAAALTFTATTPLKSGHQLILSPKCGTLGAKWSVGNRKQYRKGSTVLQNYFWSNELHSATCIMHG
jgi:hypothetical protein